MSDSTMTLEERWSERACADIDTEVFFLSTTARVREAQQICASCPVLALCAQSVRQDPPFRCVVASVQIPGARAAKSKLDRAERELAEVAATGRPAPLAKPKAATRRTAPKSGDPEFRARARELRAQGLGWPRVAAQLGCGIDTARRACGVEVKSHALVQAQRITQAVA